jgi:hypothetical protein
LVINIDDDNKIVEVDLNILNEVLAWK